MTEIKVEKEEKYPLMEVTQDKDVNFILPDDDFQNGIKEEAPELIQFEITEIKQELEEEETNPVSFPKLEHSKSDSLFHCEICDKFFKSKLGLNYHKTTLHSNQIFSCPICIKSFGHKTLLKSHMKTHSDEKLFECEVCKAEIGEHKTFKTKLGLKYHMDSSHNKKNFGCSVCFKTFSNQQLLNRHMRIHDEERPFECPICHRGFRNFRACEFHQRVHDDEYQADSKRSTWKKSEKLTSDIKTEESKIFKCEVCSKEFKKTFEFKRHAVIHNTEANFKCSQCPRAFKGNYQLRRHLANYHSGEYTCPICKKVFNRKDRFRGHMYNHQRPNYFSCHLCPESFEEKVFLLRHVAAIHTHYSKDSFKESSEERSFHEETTEFVHMTN